MGGVDDCQQVGGFWWVKDQQVRGLRVKGQQVVGCDGHQRRGYDGSKVNSCGLMGGLGCKALRFL